MASVSGLLKVGEATGATQDIATRQRGSRMVFSLLSFVLIVGGAALGALIWQQDHEIGALSGAGLGFVLYFVVCKRLTLVQFRRKMRERGFPVDLPLRIEVTPDALLYEVGDVHHSAKWSAVSELFVSHGFWIFLAQSSPFFAPQRFFKDQSTEREFIKAALARMSAEAQSRSPGAISFVRSH